MATRARTPEEVEKFFPGFRAFIDVAEQEIPRPRNSLKKKTHYSGKKRRHTVIGIHLRKCLIASAWITNSFE